jgi:hypothetical protein
MSGLTGVENARTPAWVPLSPIFQLMTGYGVLLMGIHYGKTPLSTIVECDIAISEGQVIPLQAQEVY